MKHFLTLSLSFLALSLSAQETITYPYNPDGNADGLIAVPDIQDLLAVYGSPFSPAEIMVGDTALSEWIEILYQALEDQQAVIDSLQASLASQDTQLDSTMIADMIAAAGGFGGGGCNFGEIYNISVPLDANNNSYFIEAPEDAFMMIRLRSGTSGSSNFKIYNDTTSSYTTYFSNSGSNSGVADHFTVPIQSGQYWKAYFGNGSQLVGIIPFDCGGSGGSSEGGSEEDLGPCQGEFTVNYHGYDYELVEIGEQCWFSENCRYLPQVSPSSEGSNTSPYYYIYGYGGSAVAEAKATYNYETYGVLYNWPAVMTEGICPSGWHIPTDLEWQNMEMALGMSVSGAYSTGNRGTDQGYQMKSTSGWNSGGNGSNSSGFTGSPGGISYSGGFTSGGDTGYWWSSSASGNASWGRNLNSDTGSVYRDTYNRNYGMSARCVRD